MDKNKGPNDGEHIEAEFSTLIGHSGDAQQLHRLMLEEVRLQYEDAVTKPLDTDPGLSKHFETGRVAVSLFAAFAFGGLPVS